MSKLMMLNSDYVYVDEATAEDNRLTIIDSMGMAVRLLNGVKSCVFTIELDDELRTVEALTVEQTTYEGQRAWQINGTIRNDSEESRD